MKLEIGVLIPKKKYFHFSDYKTGDSSLMPKKYVYFYDHETGDRGPNALRKCAFY